jgi:hypothetical protein
MSNKATTIPTVDVPKDRLSCKQQKISKWTDSSEKAQEVQMADILPIKPRKIL